MMVGTQLGHQVCGILGGIHTQGVGDDKEGLCEGSNCQLFPGALQKKGMSDEKREKGKGIKGDKEKGIKGERKE